MESKHSLLDRLRLASESRATSSLRILLTKSIFGGSLIALASICAISSGSLFQANETLAQVSKIAMGLTFTLGLHSILTLRLELFTGNIMFMIAYICGSGVSWGSLKKSCSVLFVSLLGNTIGCIFTCWLMGYASGIYGNEFGIDVGMAAQGNKYLNVVSQSKISHSGVQQFTRAIGGNFLICLAILSSLGSDSVVEKYFAIALPVYAYVVVGFDHCIANIAYFSLSVMYSDWGNWARYLLAILIHISGNFIGGSLLTFAFYCGAITYE